MGRISSKKRKKTVLLRYSKRGDTVFFLSLPGFQHLFFFFADPQRLSDFLNCFVMCPVIETVFFQQFLCFFRKMNITDRYCPGDGHFYVIAIVMNLFHLLQHSINIRFVDKKVQQTLSPLLRAYEFSCTMNYYSRPESLRIAACSAKPHLSLNSPIQDILSDENIMNVILTYCPDNLRNILSNFKNYNKMSDLFNILNRDQNGSNSFLNPAQQKMYEAYTEQLNNLNL